MDAFNQLIETLRWRRDSFGGVDKSFAGDDPNEEFFQINCPHVYRGYDREGRPISYERTGVYHLPTILEGVGEEGILRRRVHHQELMARKMREKSKELGKVVTQQVWVLDARDISLKPTGPGPGLFQKTIKLDSTYYPERLGYMFIINAPWIFKPLWAMVKPWLDPNTAQKIRVFGSSDYQEELQKLIPPDQIPKEYGGTANFKVPGRPANWSDVDDKDDENGYHEITLSRGSVRKQEEGGSNNNNNDQGGDDKDGGKKERRLTRSSTKK